MRTEHLMRALSGRPIDPDGVDVCDAYNIGWVKGFRWGLLAGVLVGAVLLVVIAKAIAG